MSEKSELPYFVEVDQNGCAHCGEGRTWTVCGPDEVWASVSFSGPEGEEQAEDLAERLNSAFDAGLKTGRSRLAAAEALADRLGKILSRSHQRLTEPEYSDAQAALREWREARGGGKGANE